MARGKKKESVLTPEEKLAQALVPVEEQPYQVPENWCWARIGAISDFERGITFPASAKENEPTEENIPCLRTANVQENLEIDDLIYVNQSFMKGNEAKLVRENDIIMSSANSRELVGKASFVTHVPFPMTFGGFVLNIRARGISSKYLFYFLRQEFLAGKFMGESTQTTNIANINTTTLGSYELPLPPLAEQQRIVDRIEYLFAKLDEAKEKAQSVLDSFETRKAAILHKAFTGELTAKWRAEHGVEMESWVNETLQSVCSMKITDGTHKTPTSCDADVGVPFISAKDVTGEVICWDKIKYIVPELHEELYARLAPQLDDILLAKNGTTGVAAIVDVDKVFDLYVTLAVLRPDKSKILPRYLLRIVNSPVCKNQFDEHLTGIGVPNLHLRDIKEVVIQVPSLAEQAAIIQIVDSIMEKEQQAKEAAEAVLDKIDLLKKSILARAFRGELGTNDPTEESALELLKEILKGDI